MSYVWETGAGVMHCASLPKSITTYIEVDTLPDAPHESWIIDWNTNTLTFDQTKIDIINAEIEQQWVKEELNIADIELSKVQDSDSRAIGTVGDWRAYRKALRNHVIGGVVQGTRPTRPQ